VSQDIADCVVRVEPSGAVHTVVELDNPGDVAIDENGTLYVAEDRADRVVAVSPGGYVDEIVSGLDGVRALARDGGGNLYVADLFGTVRRVEPGGVTTVVAGDGDVDPTDGAPARNVRVSVRSVAVDGDGNLYLGELYRNKVWRVDPAGRITTAAGTGKEGDTGDGGPATAAHVSPAGLAVDGDGNLYIADDFGHRVRRVDRAGTITTVAGTGAYGRGGDGGPALEAQLDVPGDLAFADGNLYIAQSDRVRRVDREGVITTVGLRPAPR
jgi:sugar lactone lactonase YvrE